MGNSLPAPIEIHFHPDGDGASSGMLTSWYETETTIERRQSEIHTTQMGLLSADLWSYGYRIWIHDIDGTYELVPGSGNEQANRELRLAHNLFKMWRAGAFRIS